MEFSDVGKNCSFEVCNQLDFLPFYCACCKSIYCLDHRYPTAHKCSGWGVSEKNIQLCSTCSLMLLIPPGMSDEKVLDEHLKSNCTLHLLSSSPSTTRKKCYLEGCNNRPSEGGVMIYVVCDGCGEVFCLKHRHPPTHQCASLNAHAEAKTKRREMAEQLIAKYFKKSSDVTGSSKPSGTSSPAAASSTHTSNINKSPKKKRNKMIETMRLKSKAQGDDSIPSDSRLYLSVVFPRDSKVNSKSMFFNKNWAIGKVLDKIATEGRIRNVNNQLSSDDPERFVLLNAESGNILGTERKLGELVESGDSVALEKLGNVGDGM